MAKSNLTFHTAVYSGSNFLAAMAGLISFPIITRVMTPEEYGILNLISLMILVLVALGKAGLQTSIIRFGSEARSQNSDIKSADVYLTALIGMFVIGATIQSLWSLISQFLPLRLVGHADVYSLFIIAGMMVLGQVVSSGIHNIFVSEKKSLAISVITVIKKYSLLFVLIPALLYFEEKVFAFYIVSGIHEIIFLILFTYICHRYFRIFEGRPSLSLNNRLLAYGLPLIGYELLGRILMSGDRLQINYFLGTEALGYYAAASNLCVYVKTIIVFPLITAVTPMYMDMWENEGRKSTEDFLNRVMRYYLMLAIPVATGAMAVGQDLITLLAGERYAEGHHVIPYLIVSMLIDGSASITIAGLRIRKGTMMMMAIVACAAIINIILNFALIPLFGAQGAACATLIAFFLYAALGWFFGRHVIRIKLDFPSIARCLFASLIMFFTISSFNFDSLVANLLTKIILGCLIYAAIILIIDGEARRTASGYLTAAVGRFPAFKTR